MKFDQLRRAVQMTHVKPIKDLEGIPDGIAEFEITLEEYGGAGGDTASDRIPKSDLLATLPAKLQSDLLWNSTNPKESYREFRDLILTQSARILDLQRRTGRGGVHAVEPTVGYDPAMPPLGASCAQEMREDDLLMADNNPISSPEGLLAMVNRQRAGGASGRPNRPQQRSAAGGDRQPRGDSDRPRAPRKCANCGKEHEARICPHPAVPREQRAFA